MPVQFQGPGLPDRERVHSDSTSGSTNSRVKRSCWPRCRALQRIGRQAIGAEVELRVGNRVLRRSVMPSRSYLSQVELPVTFGLGADHAIDSLLVRWPNGQVQEVDVDAVDRTLEVVQGG